MEKRLWFSIVSAAIGVGLIIAASATAAPSAQHPAKVVKAAVRCSLR